MSVVTIQLGQCGNQVGAELFENLAAASAADGGGGSGGGDSAFFRPPSMAAASEGHPAVARAVMVDMEPKVIQETLGRVRATRNGWKYSAGHQYAKAGGSGNNWALGYAVHGPEAAKSVLDLVSCSCSRSSDCASGGAPPHISQRISVQAPC